MAFIPGMRTRAVLPRAMMAAMARIAPKNTIIMVTMTSNIIVAEVLRIA
jgi:hypothetical protein